MKLRGRYIVLMLKRGGDYIAVGYSTACVLTVIAHHVEVAAQNGAAKAYKAGCYEYNIAVDKLYEGDVRNGDTLEWVLDFNGNMLTGNAEVSSGGINARVGGNASSKVALAGNGVIRWVDIDNWDLGDSSVVSLDEIVDLGYADNVSDDIIDFQ